MTTSITLTREEKLAQVEAKFGQKDAEAASQGMYYRKEIAIIMHGPIIQEWDRYPSKDMRMEDGTVLGWMYEDRYWEKNEE